VAETNMNIVIEAYTDEMCGEVVLFNERLNKAGVPYHFPASPIPAWLPKTAGRTLFQEMFLAVDRNLKVRGGYLLKHHDSWIGGRTVSIADFQLPLSEGTINRAYALVGPRLLFDALKRQPLLYGLGIGGSREPLARLLKAAGWNLHAVPFYFRVVRPFRFLRNMVYVRNSALRRAAFDLLAFSGLGWLGIRGIQALRARHSPANAASVAETVDEFGDWATTLWNAHKQDYGMVSLRDADTLRVLYPPAEEKFIRVRVAARGETVGWAVLLNTQRAGHAYFGSLRLGSIIDCFAPPSSAGVVVAHATRFLEELGVDLIVSNQSHAAWSAALAAAGYLRGPSNFIFSTSKELTNLLASARIGSEGVHFNRGDGDGPINL
jgi:hypothetical protein